MNALLLSRSPVNSKGGFPSSLPLACGGGPPAAPPPPPPPPVGMVEVVVVVGGIIVVEVPACDIVDCVVIGMSGAVVVVLVSSGGSTSIACVGVSVSPSPRFFGTGLMVYHLFLSSQAIKAHSRSSSM